MYTSYLLRQRRRRRRLPFCSGADGCGNAVRGRPFANHALWFPYALSFFPAGVGSVLQLFPPLWPSQARGFCVAGGGARWVAPTHPSTLDVWPARLIIYPTNHGESECWSDRWHSGGGVSAVAPSPAHRWRLNGLSASDETLGVQSN